MSVSNWENYKNVPKRVPIPQKIPKTKKQKNAKKRIALTICQEWRRAMVPTTLSRWTLSRSSAGISRSTLSRQTSLPALPKEEVDPLAEQGISRSTLSRQTSLPALPKEEVDPLAEQRMKWEKVKAPVHRLRTAVKIANARSPPSSGVQSTFFEYPIAEGKGSCASIAYRCKNC